MKHIIVFLKFIPPLCLTLFILGFVLIVTNLHLIFSGDQTQYLYLLYKVLVFGFNAKSFDLLWQEKLLADQYFHSRADFMDHFHLLEDRARLLKVFFVSVLVKLFEDCRDNQASTASRAPRAAWASCGTSTPSSRPWCST